jgi:hypothetical protein
MTIKSKLAVIATSAALGVAALGIASPVLAQSAYTTGTESSSTAAGYPSPYGGGGRYAYNPGFVSRHSSGLGAFAMVPRDPSASSLDPRATGGGSLGYNWNIEHNY